MNNGFFVQRNFLCKIVSTVSVLLTEVVFFLEEKGRKPFYSLSPEELCEGKHDSEVRKEVLNLYVLGKT